MAKDRQGIVRGKCNKWQCECMEYVLPVQSGARCDYCDHAPTEHVRIIDLGKCHVAQCECDQYLSEKKNEYTKCEYCDHDATSHEGAEKLRKTQKPAPAQPPVSGQLGAQSSSLPPQRVAAVSSSQSPSVSTVAGNVCKNPGCSRPRYKEPDGRMHDFCGLTCRNAYRKRTVGDGFPSAMTTSQPIVLPTNTLHPGAIRTPKQICTMCGQQPATDGETVCKSCGDGM